MHSIQGKDTDIYELNKLKQKKDENVLYKCTMCNF